jgi:DNA topoisomerase-1
MARNRQYEPKLIYLTDEAPGLARHGRPGRFAYVSAQGRRLSEKSTLARIKALAIPPAWTDVWIAPLAEAHLQATGRDARGRKQYRYHTHFRNVQEAAKFERLPQFVAALPKIRAQVAEDMRKPGLPQEKVVATIIHLLEETLCRIGNASYAQENKSFGLTTLKNHHASIEGERIKLIFRGKSGKTWRLELKDRRIAKIIRAAQELPGQELFQYIGEDGAPRRIGSCDVNAYLKEVSGSDITAKDFRTWAGKVLAVIELAAAGDAESEAGLKRNLRTALEKVAKRLGNTPAICRQCYVHPLIIERYLSRKLWLAGAEEIARRRNKLLKALTPQEASVFVLLKDAGGGKPENRVPDGAGRAAGAGGALSGRAELH